MLKTSSGARSARNSSYLARIQFTQELRKVENREQSLQRCLAFDKFIMDRRQQNSIEYPEPTETLLFYGAPQPNRLRAVLMRGQFFFPLKSHRMELTQARLHQRAKGEEWKISLLFHQQQHRPIP